MNQNQDHWRAWYLAIRSGDVAAAVKHLRAAREQARTTPQVRRALAPTFAHLRGEGYQG